MSDDYLQRRQNIKMGIEKPDGPKPYKGLKPIGDKKAAAIKERKELGEDGLMDKFFADQRPKLTGLCQCGCRMPSQKKDDVYFRYCICHVFPKRLFESVARNPLNWVERRFFGGCHTNLDEKGMDLWPNMADWDKIKDIFKILAPQLTDQERKTKFYRTLADLVIKN